MKLMNLETNSNIFEKLDHFLLNLLSVKHVSFCHILSHFRVPPFLSFFHSEILIAQSYFGSNRQKEKKKPMGKV